MFMLFNTFGKHIENFQPVNKEIVTVFTCGPSVYQHSHIGNFRTFLFEDIVVRYLEYLGYQVERGMNITDIEDKAIKEAEKIGMSVKALADRNIETFLKEMQGLRMKIPDFLPRASEAVEKSVEIIERLVDLKSAYWHDGNCYFDPLKYPGFGELYGLDMQKWPKRKKRFHKDTYPGMRWNRGDFILWHGYKEGDTAYWDKRIGNILYTDDLQEKRYDLSKIRFFLIYGHYRKKLNYSDKRIQFVAERLRKFKEQIKKIENSA